MKICILGAGGVRTPLIVQAMANRQESLGLTNLTLMDVDRERLSIIGTITHQLEVEKKINFNIHRTTSSREALDGADFVITTFRVGGIESRVIDERTALDLGVLGQETTGPGGFAMAMRTIPVLFNYIEQMRSYCPNAWLINFANPAGMLAEAIIREAGWKKAVGICDAPSSMGRIAAAVIGVPYKDLYLDYFGLNHLGWIRSIRINGFDYLPGLLETIKELGGFPELPFDPDFLMGIGMIPNEYLYYYYHSRQAVQNILTHEETRGEQIYQLNKTLFDDLQVLMDIGDPDSVMTRYQAYLDERGQTYMTSETGKDTLSLSEMNPDVAQAITTNGYAGVALDLIECIQGNYQRPMILNVPNHGAITGMDEEDVVEIPAYVGKGFVQPMAVGKIPLACLGLIKQVKAYERLTISAALEGSYAKAVEALTIHPLVADHQLSKKLVDRYITGHADLFPVLK